MSEIIGEITSFMMTVNGTPVSVTLRHPIKVYGGKKIRLPEYLLEAIQNILSPDIPKPAHPSCDKNIILPPEFGKDEVSDAVVQFGKQFEALKRQSRRDANCLQCPCNSCDVGHPDLECKIVLCAVNNKPLCPGEDGDCNGNKLCPYIKAESD